MCVSHRNYLLLLLWSLVCAAVDGWTAPILLGTTSNRRHPSWASGALSTTTTAIEQQESSATSSTTRILTDDCDFVKPDRDFRQYRWIELPNHLQALIVSDNITGIGVEAASVHVQAGHFDDTIPGLAHFHEHLVRIREKRLSMHTANSSLTAASHSHSCTAILRDRKVS